MLGQFGRSVGVRPGHLLEVVPSTTTLLSASSHRVMSAGPRDSRTETSLSLSITTAPLRLCATLTQVALSPMQATSTSTSTNLIMLNTPEISKFYQIYFNYSMTNWNFLFIFNLCVWDVAI